MLPFKPQKGKCYMRCSKNGMLTDDWREIPCYLTREKTLKIENFKANTFTEKDKKEIAKKIIRNIHKRYIIRITSHFHSAAPDSLNLQYAIDKAHQIGNYLKTQGVLDHQIILQAAGNSDYLVKCKTGDCSKYYHKNSRFTYYIGGIDLK